MDPLSATIMAGASLMGGVMQNKAGKAAAARQMEFQKDMSNTSYQRAVADMRKAGINPLLAYMKGGASTPAGSTYSPQNVGAAASQGYSQGASSAKTLADIGITNEQIAKISAETEMIQQTKEFNAVLHDERFVRLFATMAPENVAASVIAVLNRVDIEHVLKGLGANSNTNLARFLDDVQTFRSHIARETKGFLSVVDMAKQFFEQKMKGVMK